MGENPIVHFRIAPWLMEAVRDLAVREGLVLRSGRPNFSAAANRALELWVASAWAPDMAEDLAAGAGGDAGAVMRARAAAAGPQVLEAVRLVVREELAAAGLGVPQVTG